MSTPKLPKGICPLPWVQFSVNTDTTIRVCCNTDHGGQVRNHSGEPIYLSDINSIDDAMNQDSIRMLRKQMLAGERPGFCQNCHRVEDSGGTSIRQHYVRAWENVLRGEIERTEPDGRVAGTIRYLDLSLGNHCNLKCRMCDPIASFNLGADFQSCGIAYDKAVSQRAHDGWSDEARLLKMFSKSLPEITEVLTTGGEPFLSRLHVQLLQAAVDAGLSSAITLRYHTNLTVLPPKLLELWQHFKRIEVHASLEGVGALNEYIRYPSKWETTTKTLNGLIALKNELPLWLEVHTCFQAYSALSLHELLEFLFSFRQDLPAMPHFISLAQPDFLTADVLPGPLRQLALSRIWRFVDRNYRTLTAGPFGRFNQDKIDTLMGYFSGLGPSNSAKWNEFVSYTTALDRKRGQSFPRLAPEVGPFWTPADLCSSSVHAE